MFGAVGEEVLETRFALGELPIDGLAHLGIPFEEGGPFSPRAFSQRDKPNDSAREKRCRSSTKPTTPLGSFDAPAVGAVKKRAANVSVLIPRRAEEVMKSASFALRLRP